MNKKQIIVTILVIGLTLYLLLAKAVSSELIDPQFQKAPVSLEDVVQRVTIGSKGTYGIVIKNLQTGESFSRSEHRIFEAGSLYKLWVLATAFNQIEKGELKEDAILSQKVSELNQRFNISSDSAEMREGVITLTVSQAMQQMITISHNYAALLLTEKVKISNVSKFLSNNKFNDSNVGEPPKATAGDIALFLEKLYRGELANKENSQKILDLLKKQQLNDGLPKYLPKGITVAHKTGDIGWFKHDAGIVFSPSGDYIIVVMSESDSPPGAQERVAEVSKTVYEYFNKPK